MKKYPLLPNQVRMWFEWKSNLSNLAYNTTFLFRLRGKCDCEVIKKTLGILFKRYETLRVVFSEENNIPYQALNENLEVEFHAYDFSHLKGSDQEKAVDQQLDSCFFTPFNLEKSPPHRYVYFHLEEDSSIIGFSWHHILIDATSAEIFFAEFSQVYNALMANRDVIFEKHPPTLQELINFENANDASKDISYWKEVLLNTGFSVSLPKMGRSGKQKREDKRIRYCLDQSLTKNLMQVVSQTESSLFIILMSSLQALLYCYTKQSDFAVGYSVNMRKKHTRNAIGFFVNNLPMVAQIDKNTSFLDLVVQIQNRRKFETVSLGNIIQEIRKTRETPYRSLFNIQVNQSSYLSFRLGLEGVKSDPIPITDIDAENELTMRYDHFETIELEFDYRSACFSQEFVEGLIKNYEIVLKEITECLEINIHKDLCFLEDYEKDKILKLWNSTEEYFKTPNTLHELFEAQESKTPNKLAVIKNDQSITYQQLNERANQLAQYLRSKGIVNNTLVAVQMHPSIDMIIAIMGILKAGGAYVPIDPEIPEERLNFILKDTKASIVLRDDNIAQFLNQVTICPNQFFRSHPQDLAYVIYTSGSTGLPKGVMIEHQSCVNYINWCQKAYPVDGGDKIPLVSSFAFDMSITSLFLSLVIGKTIVMNEDTLMNSFEEICLIKMTPSHLKMLSHPQGNMKPITFVIGGEDFKRDEVNFLKKMYPAAVIYNEYGPTEATVACSAYQIDCADLENSTQSIPIGKPISNVKLYILDEFLRPVPIGCIGELYIGGVGVSRGYLNQENLTQEKFIKDPFNENSRLYQSGDMARFLPDGNIEFLGRRDTQIKIKGFRIELKEIEMALKKHGDIKEAIVVKNENEQLVAYFIPNEFIPSSAELATFLKSNLPYYMIPESFISIESLPLTPNGKLDYHALRLLNPQVEDHQTKIALESETEKAIAKIWTHLLKIEAISRQDNFFKMGGHSLSATQCASQLRSIFNVEISLRMLFELPTIAELAKFIDEQPKKVMINIPRRNA